MVRNVSLRASRDDPFMDALVGLKVIVHVAMQVVAVHFVVQPLDLGDFFVGDGLAGKPSGEALQAAHDVEKLLQIALAELAHARAAVRQQFDQALGGKHLERLAQGGAGNSEHFAELPFGNASAVRNVAFDHIVAKPRQDFPVERGLGAVGAVIGEFGDWHPGFGNRRFHRRNSSLRKHQRR